MSLGIMAPRHRSTRPSLQEGQAIVLIALLILVLFGMLGLAIDSGRAYVDRRDQQAAIDASALAAGDWYQNYLDINNYAIPKAVALYQNNLHLYAAPLSSSHPPFSTVGPFSLQQDTYDYTFAGGYALHIVATNNQFNGYQFVFTTTHTLPLAFIQIFGGSPTVGITATATSIVFNQRQTPALLTLSTGNCATNLTGGAQLTVLGNIYTNGTACLTSGLHLSGSCYGAAGSQCSSAQYWCYNPSPGFIPYPPICASGDSLGTGYVPAPPLPDPGYLAPSVPSYQTAQGAPSQNRGTYGELQPGVYSGFFHLTGANVGCYFLDPGVYSWNANYTSDSTGSFVSNELKPPDEQLYSAPGTTQLANPQFWSQNQSGTGCAGDFTLAMVSTPTGNGIAEKGPRNKLNQWGVELTSVRFDTFNDPGITPNPCYPSPGFAGCARESAPSECQLTPGNITNNGTTGLDINITKNAPGAQYYNVYLNVNGCDGVQGNFAFYGRFLAPGFKDLGGVPPASASNPYMGGTPPASPDGSALNPYPTATPITLGFTALQPANFASVMNFNHLGVLYTPTRCAGLTRTQGCLPTANELQPQCFQSCPVAPGTLSQENAATDLQYSPYAGGDLANQNYCLTSPNPGVTTAPCQGAQITPGAVQFYFPNGSCMSQNATGATYVFSGKQYNWIVIYSPASNTCAPTGNKLNGGSATQYIGTIYTPGASWSINGGNRAPLSGQVICYSATIAGGATVGIDFNPNYGPAPPAARLVN